MSVSDQIKNWQDGIQSYANDVDIKELEELLKSAVRPTVKSFLETQITAVKAQITNLEKVEEQNKPKCVSQSKVKPQVEDLGIKFIPLSSFSWDQNEKSVSIYIMDDINGIQDLNPEFINVKFDEREFDLTIENFKGKNLRLHRNNLCKAILPSKSSFKVKKDMIVIKMIKEEKDTWDDLLEKKKTFSEPKTDPKDPGAGLMDLMKTMYQEGDPEMKRTIAKAWTESQEKKQKEGGVAE